MNKAFAEFCQAKLIPALLSGAYKPGRGNLHLVDSEGVHRWCCLGVACDMKDIPAGKSAIMPVFFYDGYLATLPYAVAREFGVTDIGASPEIEAAAQKSKKLAKAIKREGKPNGVSWSLAGINDFYTDPFPVIADVLSIAAKDVLSS